MHEMIQKMCTRRAIRRFQSRQLDESVLEEILTAGLYAPSAGNNQLSRIRGLSGSGGQRPELGKISRYMQFKGLKVDASQRGLEVFHRLCKCTCMGAGRHGLGRS